MMVEMEFLFTSKVYVLKSIDVKQEKFKNEYQHRKASNFTLLRNFLVSETLKFSTSTLFTRWVDLDVAQQRRTF